MNEPGKLLYSIFFFLSAFRRKNFSVVPEEELFRLELKYFLKYFDDI